MATLHDRPVGWVSVGRWLGSVRGAGTVDVLILPASANSAAIEHPLQNIPWPLRGRGYQPKGLHAGSQGSGYAHTSVPRGPRALEPCTVASWTPSGQSQGVRGAVGRTTGNTTQFGRVSNGYQTIPKAMLTPTLRDFAAKVDPRHPISMRDLVTCLSGPGTARGRPPCCTGIKTKMIFR